MEYRIKIEYKGDIVEIKPNADAHYEVFVAGKTDPNHACLDNKVFVCKLYNALLAEIRKTPATYFKKLEFNELVTATNLIVGAERFLIRMRCRNGQYGHSNKLMEDTREEVRAAVRDAFNFETKRSDSFSHPQNWALYSLSDRHIGGELSDYDFEGLFDPCTDSETALDAKLKEFEKYPFDKFAIGKTDILVILDKVTKFHRQTKQSIGLFRKMRDVAGNDVVNWGAHKWASQLKKEGIKLLGNDKEYCAKHWLIDTYRQHLISEGVKPAAPSGIAALKNKDVKQLNQDDLVRRFKNAANDDISDCILAMTPATAASLLAMTTKNVVDKLYEMRKEGEIGSWKPKALDAIVHVIGSSHNPVEFKLLIDFLKPKGMLGVCDWDLFTQHVNELDRQDFLNFVSFIPKFKARVELNQDFFTKVLAGVSEPYSKHPAITEAFLRYQATVQDKIAVLKQYAMFSDGVRIDFSRSAVHFQGLPYSELHAFFLSVPQDVTSPWAHFQDLIFKNKDTELAERILRQDARGLDGVPYSFFKLFDFDTRVSILDEMNDQHIDIKKVINATEYENFARVAMTKEHLCEFVDKLPVANLNESLRVADVTGRILNSGLHVPLTPKILGALDKESTKRVVARGNFSRQDNDLVVKLYNKLTRAELIEAIGPLDEHPDRECLIDRMTPDEIMTCCDKNDNFLRKHVEQVPLEYFDKFRDKEVLKQKIGGSRRSRRNRVFGARMDARIAELKD